MSDRNCKDCIYANWKSEYDNGCSKWDCEYVSKKDAVSKEKVLQIAWETVPDEYFIQFEEKVNAL